MATITRNSKIKAIMNKPEAMAIIEKHLPDLTKKFPIEQGAGFPLASALAFPMAGVSTEQAEALYADLEAAQIAEE
jgi:hypothetical protein